MQNLPSFVKLLITGETFFLGAFRWDAPDTPTAITGLVLILVSMLEKTESFPFVGCERSNSLKLE